MIIINPRLAGGILPLVLTCLLALSAQAIPQQAAAVPVLYEDLKLTPLDGEPGDRFGRTVALSDGFAAVRASLTETDGYQGAVYSFNADTGEQLHRLRLTELPDEEVLSLGLRLRFDSEGSLLALINNLFLDGTVGIPHTDLLLARFDPVTGVQQGIRPVALPGDSGLQLRSNIDLDYKNDRMLLNNSLVQLDGPLNDPDVGIAKLTSLVVDGLNVTQSVYGDHVALGDHYAAIGAPGVGPDDQGAVYVFRATDGVLVAELRPSDGFGGDLFGSSIDVVGDRVIVGAPAPWRLDDPAPRGAAYIFTIVPEPTSASLAWLGAGVFGCRRQRRR